MRDPKLFIAGAIVAVVVGLVIGDSLYPDLPDKPALVEQPVERSIARTPEPKKPLPAPKKAASPIVAAAPKPTPENKSAKPAQSFSVVELLKKPGKYLFKKMHKVPKITQEVKLFPLMITGYDPYDEICNGEYFKNFEEGHRVTASNSNAEIPGAAADWDVIPKGSRIILPEDFPPIEGMPREFIVDDQGGKMRQDAKIGIYHVDLRFVAQIKRKEGEPDRKNPTDEEKKEAHETAGSIGGHVFFVTIIPPDKTVAQK